MRVAAISFLLTIIVTLDENFEAMRHKFVLDFNSKVYYIARASHIACSIIRSWLSPKRPKINGTSLHSLGSLRLTGYSTESACTCFTPARSLSTYDHQKPRGFSDDLTRWRSIKTQPGKP